MQKTGLSSTAVVIALFLALIGINVIAALLPWQLDITEDSLYTLSEGTKNIIQEIEEPITIKFFHSSSRSNIPVQVRAYARKIEDFLRQYENSGNVTLEIIDPEPDTDAEEWAMRYGLNSLPMPSGDRLFMGAVMLSGQRESAIPFFDFSRERFLEYDISDAISRLSTAERQRVGIITSLPIMGDTPLPGQQQPPRPWAFVSELQKNFDIEYINPATAVFIPEDIDLLVALHPNNCDEGCLYAIDQFVLRGGRLVALLDPFSRNQNPADMGGALQSSNLGKLLDTWGITFDNEKILGDLLLSTRVSVPQQGLVDYPVWISFNTNSMDKDSVITSNLDDIMFPEAGVFEFKEDSNNTVTPLITSSEQSGFVNPMSVRLGSPLEIAKEIKPDDTKKVTAALVTGAFKSAFPEGTPSELLNKDNAEAAPEAAVDDHDHHHGHNHGAVGEQDAHTAGRNIPDDYQHISEASATNSIILVGDTDFLNDDYSVQTVNLLGQIMFSPINDNIAFLLNSVEFLAGDQNLILIRSRGQARRPFTTLTSIQLDAQQKYQQEEEQLSQKLEEVRSRISALEDSKSNGGSNVILSSEQLAEVQKFRLEEAETRRALRDVRKVLRQDIESLGNYLFMFNLLFVPVIVAVIGIVIIRKRLRN